MTAASRPTGQPAPQRSHVQLASALLVVVATLGLDVLADQDLTHLLEVGTLAGAVGLMRLSLRDHLPRLFVLVNVAVLAQPAIHAITGVAHSAAERLPHGHAVDDEIWAVGLQVVITLLVVLVAASEPLLAFVASTRAASITALLAFAVPAPPVPPAAQPAPEPPPDRPPQVATTWFRPRRGPPRPVGIDVVHPGTARRWSAVPA